MPKISICVPTYNQTKYLIRTLESILDQNFEDYEVIISDDSTTTDVKNLVDQFDFKGKLSYYHNSLALGTPENWNAAIVKANGDYIKILHHDDWFTSPESLMFLVEEIEKNQTDFVFPNAELIFEKSNKSGVHRAEDSDITLLNTSPNILFVRNFVGSPSMTLFKKDESLTFDKNLKWLVDVDFYIRYLQKHGSPKRIDKYLVATLTDSDNTVTAACLNNKRVEVFENFYLFHKLKSTFPLRDTLHIYFFLIHITDRFRVLTLAELKELGVPNTMPLFFRILFYLNKPVRLIKKINRFLSRNFKSIG